ncbi:MAG: hypothetical protein QM817_37610 [Archangium sp.]
MRRSLVLAFAFAGCDFGPYPLPDAGGGGDGGVNGSCDAPALFARSCVNGCHDATTKQGNLDLSTPPLESRLFGRHASARPDYLLIDPELPEESALVVKLSSMPPFGAQMPLGTALNAADRACVQQWVNSVIDAGLSDAGFTYPDAGGVDAGVLDGGSDAGSPPDAGTFDAGRFWGPLADDAGCAPAIDAGQWCVFQVVPEPLYAVRGVASDDVWAVGSRGAAYHFDGNAWARSDSGVSVTLFDVFPVAANDVWAVGERGLVLHFDSSGWQAQSWSPSSTVVDAGLLASGQPTWDLGGVWVEGNEVWVGGGGSTLARRVGGSMQVLQTSHPNMPSADFIRVYARGPNEWWVGGDMTFYEWDGAAAQWSAGRGAIMRAFGMAGSVHPTMGRILVAVGADGQMLQYGYSDTGMYPWQPPNWNAETYELRRDLRSVWLTADGGLGWTVGLDGEIVSLDLVAHRYARSMTPTSDHLLGVWGLSVRETWAVGGRSTGVLLRSR